jgi:hypothetical protein
MTICAGEKRDGAPCTVTAPPGERFCYGHDPVYAEERRRSASRAATAKHSSVGRELGEVRGLIRDLLGVLLADELSVRIRRELQNVVQLLQTYARLAELEMRAGEEPLKGDLDAVGLRAQILERIETLEERERERRELLAGLVPLLESRGYDAGDARALLGR